MESLYEQNNTLGNIISCWSLDLPLTADHDLDQLLTGTDWHSFSGSAPCWMWIRIRNLETMGRTRLGHVGVYCNV